MAGVARPCGKKKNLLLCAQGTRLMVGNESLGLVELCCAMVLCTCEI